MKIPASDIQAGDRIFAYCNNKMQVCKVKYVLDPDLSNVNLSVTIPDASRNLILPIVRFRRDALVELYAKSSNSSESTECVGEQP